MTQGPKTPDFDAVYRADDDPWSVRTGAYERRKLGILLACLARSRYAVAWDPSCGVGELAYALADRSGRVLATDASIEAVALTRRRCADRTNVEVGRVQIPARAPVDDIELIVISEFWFYLSPQDRRDGLTLIERSAASSAEIVSLHWRPKPHDGWLSGYDVQAEIGEQLTDLGWSRTLHHEESDFILDAHQRGQPDQE